MDIASMAFERVSEPREKAFTILVPQGWQLEGGMVRPDFRRQWIGPQTIEVKVDLIVKRDDQASVMLRFCPEVKYCDPRCLITAQMGLTRVGDLYRDMPVYPVMSPIEYLREIVFPWAHPNARGVEVVEEKEMPELVERYLSYVVSPLIQSVEHRGGGVTFDYVEGALRLREKAYTVIENLGAFFGGMWSNKTTMLHRAPADEFAQWEPVLQRIQDSVELNPAWIVEERISQEMLTLSFMDMQAMERWRFQRLLDIQRETQDTLQRMRESQMRGYARWRHRPGLPFLGYEPFYNPFLGRVEYCPSYWRYRWVTPMGHEFYTDHASDNPNVDHVCDRSDWQPSPIKDDEA